MGAIRRLLAPVAASCLAACAPGGADLRLYTAPLPPNPSLTLTELGRVRGIPVDAPVPVETVDDATFLAAFRAMNHAGSQGAARLGAFYSAFGLKGDATDVAAISDRLIDDNLRGFYDPHTKHLYVRRGATLDLSTLAHEEQHALQDRFFGIPDLERIADGDELLATRALFEGDATVASVVLGATRQGSPPATTLAALARLGENDDATLLRGAAFQAPKDAPPLLIAEITWPYIHGSAFIARLASSGGWALVNEALRNPPKTTEQVLHIEKYLAGERAVEVHVPSAPEGSTLVESGHMGELRTRFLLAKCMPDVAAATAASGWGGDSFAIVATGSDRALLWSTAWDDVASADRFASALENRRVCPRSGPQPAFTVFRDGARVAVVQGLASDPERAREGAVLLSLVGRTPPPVPPIGAVRLAPRPPIEKDFMHGGVVVQGAFQDPLIGLTTSLDGLRVRKDDALELAASGPFVRVNVGFVWAPAGVALGDFLVQAFVDAYSKRAPHDVVLDAGTSSVALQWTQADARALRIGGKLDVRFVLAPMCQGKMTLFLITAATRGTSGGAAVDRWLASIRATDGSPACEALKTLRDPSQ